MNQPDASPVARIYQLLLATNSSWNAQIGRPTGAGWIAGNSFRDATAGPFNELLTRIGAILGTTDKLTIAASFSLRFGWASAMAIVPYLRFRCVPDIALSNVSFKFAAATYFERTAVCEPRGVMVEGARGSEHPSITTVRTDEALLRVLRDQLVTQSAPMVDALYQWSGFAHRATWGMLTSAWASQFTSFARNPRDQRDVTPLLDALFAGDDIVSETRPTMRALTYRDETHLYQRRASCCRLYLLPQGDLCASCPLVGDEERLQRNVEWMASQYRPILHTKRHS